MPRRDPAGRQRAVRTFVSPAELAKLDTRVPGYQPSPPYGPGGTYDASSCLDVCPIKMTSVHVTATVPGDPSLATDHGTFSCVTSDVTECN